MGKVKKQKNYQKTPYDRPNPIKAAESAAAKVIDDEMIENEQDGDEPNEKVVSRAGLLRRQKLEMRALQRSTVAGMKQQRSKLSKRVDAQLVDRKSITRDMKSLVAELEEKHKKELEEFDAKQAKANSIDVVDKKLAFKASLPSGIDMNDLPEIKFDLVQPASNSSFASFAYREDPKKSTNINRLAASASFTSASTISS